MLPVTIVATIEEQSSDYEDLFSESKSVAICEVFILTVFLPVAYHPGHVLLLFPNLTIKWRSRRNSSVLKYDAEG